MCLMGQRAPAPRLGLWATHVLHGGREHLAGKSMPLSLQSDFLKPPHAASRWKSLWVACRIVTPVIFCMPEYHFDARWLCFPLLNAQEMWSRHLLWMSVGLCTPATIVPHESHTTHTLPYGVDTGSILLELLCPAFTVHTTLPSLHCA